VIDASDTGSGKTYCAIAVCNLLKLTPFIVCPKSVIANWKNVCDEFQIKYLGISNYESLKSGKYYTQNYEKVKCPYMDIIPTKYTEKMKIKEEKDEEEIDSQDLSQISKLKKEAPALYKYIEKTKHDYQFYLPKDSLVIFDEAHRCKNWSSQTSNLLIAMNKCDCKIMMLSATLTDKIDCFKPFGIVLNFYKTLPEHLIKYFPIIYDIGDNVIEMDRIEGVVFSELLVSKSLTEKQLVSLLDTINNIYSDIDAKNNNNIYLNYASKIETRFRNYENDYKKLPNSDKIFQYILAQIKNYEDEKRGVYSSVIHGDPVFSNIILTENNDIKLFDPRGKLGNILTNEGDICYDFSKILQSLYGYDFIIMGKEIDDSYLKSLRNVFYGWIKDKYESIDINDLQIISASLILSLIPLHKTENHLKFFYLIDNINLKKYF
jgi:hypothetical protein